MLNVILLRHGQTPYNADNNRYCGRTDVMLTEKGLGQAESVRQRLVDVDIAAVYSSPLQRAVKTAELATGRPPIIDERLIELDFGLWEGKTKEEFIAENPASWSNWMNDPAHFKAGDTGEDATTVVTRVDAFFNEMLAKHAGGIIVVAGHNGINRLYMAYKLGMQLKDYRKIVQENAAVTMFELDENGDFSLTKLNA